jgi:hypothetical protein
MFLYRNAHQGRVPDMTQRVLFIQGLLDIYANFNSRSKHSKVGIFNDENVKEFNFIKIFKDACIYKKVSGSAET